MLNSLVFLNQSTAPRSATWNRSSSLLLNLSAIKAFIDAPSPLMSVIMLVGFTAFEDTFASNDTLSPRGDVYNVPLGIERLLYPAPETRDMPPPYNKDLLPSLLLYLKTPNCKD